MPVLRAIQSSRSSFSPAPFPGRPSGWLTFRSWRGQWFRHCWLNRASPGSYTCLRSPGTRALPSVGQPTLAVLWAGRPPHARRIGGAAAVDNTGVVNGRRSGNDDGGVSQLRRSCRRCPGCGGRGLRPFRRLLAHPRRPPFAAHLHQRHPYLPAHFYARRRAVAAVDGRGGAVAVAHAQAFGQRAGSGLHLCRSRGAALANSDGRLSDDGSRAYPSASGAIHSGPSLPGRLT